MTGAVHETLCLMSLLRFASLLGACTLALLLGSSALAEEPSLSKDDKQKLAQSDIAQGSERPVVQLIGWSPDEQRYAFRVFSHEEEDLDMAPPEDVKAAEEVEKYNAERQDKDGFCKGYVDHQGKRFKGALQLIVFERDQRLMTLPIQDEPRCTEPQTATERLTAAKAKLAELGIDLARSSKEQPLVPRQRLAIKPEKQSPYELEYVSTLKDKNIPDEGVDTYRLRGALELYVHRQGKKQPVFTHKVDTTYERSMAGKAEEGLTNAYVSPSGERVVVLGYTLSGAARGGYTHVLRVATVVGGSPGTITREK